jgi:hypothetical protein
MSGLQTELHGLSLSTRLNLVVEPFCATITHSLDISTDSHLFSIICGLLSSHQMPDKRSCYWCADKGVQRHFVANSRIVRTHRDRFYQRKGLRSRQQQDGQLDLPATPPETSEGDHRVPAFDDEDDDALAGDFVSGSHSEYDLSGSDVDDAAIVFADELEDDTDGECCLTVLGGPRGK